MTDLEQIEQSIFKLSPEDVRERLRVLDTQMEFWEKILNILEPPPPKKSKVSTPSTLQYKTQSVVDGQVNETAEPEIPQYDPQGEYLSIPTRILLALERAEDKTLTVYDLQNQLLLSTQQLQGPLNKLRHEHKIHRDSAMHVCLGPEGVENGLKEETSRPREVVGTESPIQQQSTDLSMEDQPIELSFNSLASSLRKIVIASGTDTPRELSNLGRKQLQGRTACRIQDCEQINDWLINHFALELRG